MSEHTTTLAQARIAKPAAPVVAGFFDAEGFVLMQRIAKVFAYSGLVPKQYQGDEGIPNCMIALNMSQRMSSDPMMIMQNLYPVHGQPAWSSKFLIATVNACGRYNSMRYEWKNEDKPDSDDYGCRAWTIEKETGERLNGIWITWKMVRAEGWHNKNGSKWKTMPDQMFMYRAASFWVRTNAPELSMGFQTQEEIMDTLDAGMDADGRIVVDTESLRNAETEKKSRRKTPAQDVDLNKADKKAEQDASEPESTTADNVDPETGEVLQQQQQKQPEQQRQQKPQDDNDNPYAGLSGNQPARQTRARRSVDAD